VSVLIIFSHIFVPIVVFIVSSRHHHRRVPAHEFQQLDDRQRERVLVPIAHESRQRLERIVRVVIASIVSGRASPHRSAQRRRDVRLVVVVVVVVPRPAPNDRGRRRRAASRAGVVVEVVRVVVELEQKLHLSATARPRDRATTARANGARVTPTHPKPSTRHSLNPRRARETRARAGSNRRERARDETAENARKTAPNA
jgi:hypothetical protein